MLVWQAKPMGTLGPEHSWRLVVCADVGMADERIVSVDCLRKADPVERGRPPGAFETGSLGGTSIKSVALGKWGEWSPKAGWLPVAL